MAEGFRIQDQRFRGPVASGFLPGGSGRRRVILPFAVFLFAAVALFLLLVVLGFCLVVRVTGGPLDAVLPDMADPDRAWAWWLLVTALLGFGLANLGLAAQALKQRSAQRAYAWLAILVCAGLAASGVQGVIAARALVGDKVVLDYSHLARPRRIAAAGGGGAALAGDAAAGQKLFATSCVTCHGPTGDGLNNLAPSLRASEFLKSADTAAVTRVVRLGRAVTDPANKSGKMMPAKGGNPFLTDQQVADLVAFVQGISGGTGAVAAASPAGATGPAVAAAPVPQLARWVVPAAGVPSSGLVLSDDARASLGSDARRTARASWRDGLFRGLALLSMAVHGCFLLGVVVASSHVLFGWLLEIRDAERRNRFRWLVWGWLIAGGVWLLLGLLPGML